MHVEICPELNPFVKAWKLTQWGEGLDDALRAETAAGIEVVRSGETQAGATRFAQGAGRHGRFD